MLVKCFSSAFAHKIIVVEDVTAHVTQARSDTKDKLQYFVQSGGLIDSTHTLVPLLIDV